MATRSFPEKTLRDQDLGDSHRRATFNYKNTSVEERMASKIFYHNRQPEPIYGIGRYWAFERECINCALLDMIGASLRRAKTTGNPIYLLPNPTKHKHAIRNLFAFSDEGYAKSPSPEHFVPFEPSVEINHCFGWTELSGRDINAALKRAWAHQDIDDNQTYFAIVYPFVPNHNWRPKPSFRNSNSSTLPGSTMLRSTSPIGWEQVYLSTSVISSTHLPHELKWSEHWYAKNPSMLHAAVRYQAQEGIF
ncbi:hypothetical protein FALCPG4_010055 [Fusarium falciforme]